MIASLTDSIRTYFTGKDSAYVFKRADSIKQTKAESLNLYIHIPFCNNLCPYCPYFKVKYDPRTVPAYVDAMLKEIDIYHKLFGKSDISSIYIGGGTPTLLIDELGAICRSLGKNFSIKGDVCIETNPEDITPELVEKLKNNNVTLVSVGAQSFLGKHLQFIGRNYPPSAVDGAMQQLLKANFKSVNIDLLFALPGQTEKDVIYDLEKAIDSRQRLPCLAVLFYHHRDDVRRHELELRIESDAQHAFFRKHCRLQVIIENAMVRDSCFLVTRHRLLIHLVVRVLERP